MNDSIVEPESRWHLYLSAVLRSYAVVYLSKKRTIGLLILICTFLKPFIGLTGLVGLLISLTAALLLGLHRESIRDGTYLFNSLLVSLSLASYVAALEIDFPTALLLLVVCSLMTLFLTVALTSFMYQHLGLPALTLPLVAGQVAVHWLAMPYPLRIFELRPAIPMRLPYYQDAIALVNSLGVSQHLEVLGAILFLPDPLVGGLVLLALFLHSRLAVLFSMTGFVTALGVVNLLGPDVTSQNASLIGFNGLFCGLALGGVFFIPSRSSLMLSVIGGGLAGAVGVAIDNVLRPLDFFPFLLPLNLVVLPVLYVLRQRANARHLFAAPVVSFSPEESFREFHVYRGRFPDTGLPSILCPFPGKRVVTQGVEGRLTHRGQWRYALDFEALDHRNQRNLGVTDALSDYYTFNTPVLAPGYGTVAKVIDHIEDRPIGTNNFADNWGNLVIIRLDEGPFVKLCHLQQRSIMVAEGWRVKPGDVIAQCGNSGRSPVPHLHVQLQTSAQVGATTIPFRLRHYIQHQDQQSVYHSSGLPAENARVQGAMFDEQFARCFDNIARRTYEFRVRAEGLEKKESMTCRVDDLGYYVLETATGDRLKACVLDHAFFALEYRGRAASVLHWLFIGLCRVPLIGDREAVWHDTLDIRPLLHRWAAWYFDFVGPFLYYPMIETTSSFLPAASGGDDPRRSTIGIETRLRYLAPSWLLKHSLAQRIRIQISPSDFVVDATVEMKGKTLVIEQV